MKIAYLITAYIDPCQLKNLCRSLDYSHGEDCSHFFLHIDKKVDIIPFKAQLSNLNNIHFCEKRYFINWGGYNQVISQRELLHCSLTYPIVFDRFVCISATDYPLWSNEKIFQFYKDNPVLELVGGYDLTDSRNNWQKYKVIYYHPFRDLPVPVKLRRFFSFGARTLLKIIGVKRSCYVKLSNGQKAHIFTGSDYWSITRKCAETVLQELQDNSAYIKRLKNTYIPSEIIVNTIIYNSPFGVNARPHLVIDEENQVPFPGLDLLTPLQIIVYDSAIKVWTIDDYNILAESGKMFCRKTLSGVSDELIHKIESELR